MHVLSPSHCKFRSKFFLFSKLENVNYFERKNESTQTSGKKQVKGNRLNNFLIFTDLDGTLLDHQDYSFSNAQTALDQIRNRSIPLILNSSKTESEIEFIRQQLNNQHPFIVENGSVVIIPRNYFADWPDKQTYHTFGTNRTQILKILHDLRQRDGFVFRSFKDMTIHELSKMTGLSDTEACKAKDRHATEPLVWLDTSSKFEQFESLLNKEQLMLIKGGRFWHVQGQTDKAKAMRFLQDKYAEHHGRKYISIASGDSDNDMTMLESADIAIVVKGSNQKHIRLKNVPKHIIYTQQPGPIGWQEAMLTILNCTKLERYYE